MQVNNRILRVINSSDEIPAIILEGMAGAEPRPLPEVTVILSSTAVIRQLRASSGGLSGVTFLIESRRTQQGREARIANA